jgi:hypothetical protein
MYALPRPQERDRRFRTPKLPAEHHAFRCKCINKLSHVNARARCHERPGNGDRTWSDHGTPAHATPRSLSKRHCPPSALPFDDETRSSKKGDPTGRIIIGSSNLYKAKTCGFGNFLPFSRVLTSALQRDRYHGYGPSSSAVPPTGGAAAGGAGASAAECAIVRSAAKLNCHLMLPVSVGARCGPGPLVPRAARSCHQLQRRRRRRSLFVFIGYCRGTQGARC